jgi:hypothetical protein
MENSSLPLKFECNKGIDINPEGDWDEIIQLTFLNDQSEYLSLTRLSYEDEVYVEYNDQINFLYSGVNDITFTLEETLLTIAIQNPTKGNLPNLFIINAVQQPDNLIVILNLLVSSPSADANMPSVP